MSEPLRDRTVELRTVHDAHPGYAVEDQSDYADGEDEGSVDLALSMYMHVSFVGGDPTATRVRDISVTIPIRAEDPTSTFAEIVDAVVTSLTRLGQIENFTAELADRKPGER